MEPMDAETQQVFSEGEAISDYVRTKAWRIVKEKFTNRIMDLQSVMNIKHLEPEQMAREVFARQLACDYILDLIKDVEGQAAQHNSNKSLTQDSIQII